MHIVIDRLGASGRMMQIHPAKTINPKSLRALQVDTAIEYGIALNDTPRVSRGHRDRALSSPEWRAEQRGERRERSPTRRVYSKTASDFAEDAIGREANELKKLSERYQRADTPERRKEAKALEKAAFILSSGGTLDDAPQMIAQEQPETKRGYAQQERKNEKAAVLESPAVMSETSVYRPARARVEQSDRRQHQFERSLGPNRRLTELELRALLDVKERELTERQHREEEKRQSSPEVLVHEEPDTLSNDPISAEQYESRDAFQDGIDEANSRETGRKRPLTEKELSSILSARVRELDDAEKRRQGAGFMRHPDFDLGYE